MIYLLIIISIYLVIYDIKYKKVPNYINLILLILIILNKIYLGENITISLLSGLFSFMMFFVVTLASKGGMGIGDCKYTSLISMNFGYYFWLQSITIATISALVISGILIIGKKIDKKTRIPFIPFLVFGWIFKVFVT